MNSKTKYFEASINLYGFQDKKVAQDFVDSLDRTFEEIFDKLGIAMVANVSESVEPEDV